MTYAAAIVITIVAIALVAALAWGPIYLKREKPSPSSRERYGPPPGMRRAVDHNELPDDRGWPGFDRVYEASTASAISHMIARSA